MTARWLLGVWAWAALGTFVACGGGDSSQGLFPDGGETGGKGGAGVGGAGGAAAGGAGTGGTDGGGVGGTGGGCVPSLHAGERVPLDLYVVWDRSGSMTTGDFGGTRWEVMKKAFFAFMTQGAQVEGLGLGLEFFPTEAVIDCGVTSPPNCPPGCAPFGPICMASGGGCSPNDFLPPAVIIQPLPGVRQQIVEALDRTSPGGGTPTLPAMQAALQVTTGYAELYPERKVVIVLATDGQPNDCSSTNANVALAAKEGVDASPAVLTFVIGIGSVPELDAIAASGGTEKAFVVGSTTPEQDFVDAMNQIRQAAVACELALPAGAKQGALQVIHDGKALPQRSDVASCAGQPGWAYDGSGKRIVLCPLSCHAVELTGLELVALQTGCPS
jgi:hypothetical protein